MVLPSGLVLTITTVFVSVFLLGLNALAQDNEDPFGDDGENHQMVRWVRLFESGVKQYERRRAEVEEAMKGQAIEGATLVETELWHHALMCRSLQPDAEGHCEQMKKDIGLV